MNFIGYLKPIAYTKIICAIPYDTRSQTRTFYYDVNGQLNQFVDGDGQVQFEYDPNGNLTKTIDTNATLTHTYDKLNRVESYTDSSGNELWFYYDEMGNQGCLIWKSDNQQSMTYNIKNCL